MIKKEFTLTILLVPIEYTKRNRRETSFHLSADLWRITLSLELLFNGPVKNQKNQEMAIRMK